jgi:hypothetical protein
MPVRGTELQIRNVRLWSAIERQSRRYLLAPSFTRYDPQRTSGGRVFTSAPGSGLGCSSAPLPAVSRCEAPRHDGSRASMFGALSRLFRHVPMRSNPAAFGTGAAIGTLGGLIGLVVVRSSVCPGS